MVTLASCGQCGACEKRSSTQSSVLEVDVQGVRVTLRAHGVARDALLDQLVDQAGIALHSEAPLGGLIDLDLTDVPLEAALRELLHDQAYALHYDAVATREPRALHLGPPAIRSRPNGHAAAPQAADEELQAAGLPDDPARAAPTAAPSTLVTDDSAPTRPEQALRTPPVGSGRDALVRALKADPDRAVRVAAARQLAAGEDYASTRALLAALEDDDPEVVVEALSSLASLGDPSVVAEIQAALAEQDDPRLQRELRRTVEHLHQNPRLDPDIPGITEYVRVEAKGPKGASEAPLAASDERASP